MELYSTLTAALDACMTSSRFSICRLHQEERPMDMHLHDCYEIYYSISGGLQFLIGDRLYDMAPGDLFFVNVNVSHHILYAENCDLERIMMFVHPDFIRSVSTEATPLASYFSASQDKVSCRYSLNESQQRRFLYYVDQLISADGYGADVLETCRMAEFLVYLNRLICYTTPDLIEPTARAQTAHYLPQVQDALIYINSHLHEPISLTALAEHLYLSESYLCRIFKASTGTTISKYIIGRRIAVAKGLLASGFSVAESQERCGFNDYSNFLKSFTRIVGMSPKKYAQTARRDILQETTSSEDAEQSSR